MFRRFKSQKKITEKTQPIIPSIIIETTEFLEENALDIEYIFRVPGRVTDVEELTKKFLNNDLTINLFTENIHVVASVLKNYLRIREPPLIVFKLYRSFLKIEAKQEADKNEKLTKLLLMLPEDNQIILKYIFKFLNKVANHSDINKMNSSNLAVVFGPNIFRAKKSKIKQEAKDFRSIQSLTKHFIDNCDEIFGKFEKLQEELKPYALKKSQSYSATPPTKPRRQLFSSISLPLNAKKQLFLEDAEDDENLQMFSSISGLISESMRQD
ncbi:rho gtpase-activating protein 68f [Anaeramoeba ignava]|uniref:Rho gtpase-activating protein 68f n=1 Tax=Anaeramoeba ignava TaxID=1746090 RepID=A0A9Q0LIH4_ANAIG|nr:rho gtpase-activating protein 68f [Anaeramoeba ignava]